MSSTKQTKELISAASRLRTRLVWLVGMPGSGKTNELKATIDNVPGCAYVNLNAALSSHLVGDSFDQRPFRVAQHMSAILAPRPSGAWLVDNIEILFSRALKIPVLDRLNALAQQATLVVAWPGKIESGRLIYGARSHSDFTEYPMDSPLVLDLNNIKTQGQ